MTKLCLASPELSECLCDRHTLDTALEKLVELDASCRDPLDMLALLEDLHASLEALALNLLCYLIALVGLCLCDALDVQHLLLGAKIKSNISYE